MDVVESRPGRWLAWMRIGPERAKTILDRHNTKNRTLRRARVLRYASDIRSGKWMETGQPIIIDEEGVLLTGQHTLSAVVESGLSIVTLVVVGVSADCRYFVDLGLAKALADFLYADGVGSAANVASALSYKARYDARCFLDNARAISLTNDHKRALMEQHPRLLKAVIEVPTPLPGFGGKGLWGWLLFEFERRDADLAREFVEQVLTNDGLRKGTPAFALRRRLDEARTTRGSSLRPEYVVAIAIKAWNCTRRGERRDLIGWRSGEPFPEIE
jgi:hypothetical protein